MNDFVSLLTLFYILVLFFCFRVCGRRDIQYDKRSIFVFLMTMMPILEKRKDCLGGRLLRVTVAA